MASQRCWIWTAFVLVATLRDYCSGACSDYDLNNCDLWSSAATWPDSEVPVHGAEVTITKCVLLDTTTSSLDRVTISGSGAGLVVTSEATLKSKVLDASGSNGVIVEGCQLDGQDMTVFSAGSQTLKNEYKRLFSAGTEPQVTTESGVVLGASTVHAPSGVTVEVYKGVPFADAPIGSLRFQAPQKKSPWTGVYDASNTDIKHMCITARGGAAETEDCLYLDVYRPQVSDTPLPVMAFIHGGGFSGGSKNADGTALASMGVIVVTLNYRLGPLGFLSTEDDVMPGNYGMLDQVAALQWVKDNIAAFGGDPTAVTIFGSSAGSASVGLQILSPLAKGLFQRAIMMSGPSSNSWAVSAPGGVSPRSVATTAGAELGCTMGDASFLACMQGKTATEVNEASVKAERGEQGAPWFKLLPRVETDFGFMPDYPVNLLRTGKFNKVDTIRGYNSQEQGNMGDKYENGATVADFRQFASSTLRYFPYIDTPTYVDLLEAAYLTNVTDPLDIRTKTQEMKSDFIFIAPIVHELGLYRKKAGAKKHFLYQFDYRSSFTTTPEWKGVLHVVNMNFVWGLDRPFGQLGDAADKKVADMQMTMLTNFAKEGHPTPSNLRKSQGLKVWRQFWNSRLNVMRIGAELERWEYDTPQNSRVLALWSKIEDEYVAAIPA